jgi:SLT domain-containing protein/phage-related protein
MGTLALSAVMNLGGTFQAQMQKNLEVIDRVKSTMQTTTSTVQTLGSNMTKQATEISNKWGQMGQKIDQVKKNIANSAPIKSLTNGLAVAKDAAGVAGLATAGFLKSAIDTAAKGQKINVDLAQTIKSTGGAAGLTAQQVSDMATKFSMATTYGAGTIKTGQNMLLTFTNIGKDVFPTATQAMLDMSIKMGSDLPSTAIQLGKALNDPTKGLTALSRVGVSFTEQQKEQIKTMQATGNMAGAQKIIIAELNKEFGGQAAAAASTYQGRLQQLSNTIGAIKGSIGAVLLPYVQKIAEAFLSVAQRVQSFSKPMIDVIAKVLAATAVFGTLIGGMSLLQKVIPMVVPQFSMLTTLFTKLTGPIGIVIALFAVFSYAYTKNLGGFKTFMDSVFGAVSKTFSTFQNCLKSGQSAGQAFYSAFKNIFGSGFASGVATVIDAVVFSVKGLIKFIQGDLKGSQNMFYYIFGSDDKKYEQSAAKIVSTLSIVKNGIKAALQGIMGLVTGDFKNFGSTLQNSFGISANVVGGIISVFQVVRTVVVDALIVVKTIVSSVFGFLVDHSNAVINILKLVVVGFAAMRTISTVLSIIKTVSTVFTVLGGVFNTVKIAYLGLRMLLMLNPVMGIVIGIAAVIAIIVLLWNNCSAFRNFFISVWYSIKTGVIEAIKSLENGISNTWSSIKTGVTTAFNAIKTTAVTIWNGIKSAIIAVVTPIVQGVLNVWNSMKGGITTIFAGIKNVIQGVWIVIKNIILGPVILIVDLVRGNWTKLGSDAKAIFTNLGNAFKQIWNGIKQIISGYLSAIAGLVSTIWGGLVNIVKAIWNGLGSFLSGLWNGIKALAIAAWEGLKTGVITIVQDVWLGIVTVFTSVVNFFRNLPTTLYNLGVAIFTGLKNGAWSILSTIGSWIETGFNAVVEFFSNLPSKMLEFGKNFIQGFINGVEGMIDAVINKVKNVGESIEKTIRKVLGINSPSKVMHGIGQFVVQGLANGMDTSKHLVNNAVTRIGKGLPDQFYGWGQDIPGSMADGISDNIKTTTDTITDMANKMRRIIHFTKPDEGPLHDSDTYGPDMVKGLSEGIKNNVALTTNSTTLMATDIRNVILLLVNDSLTYGQQIVTNLGQGVKDSMENLTSIVKTLTDKVITTFREGFGIHSPSRVMYQMGGHLMQGLMNGMTSKDMSGFVQSWIGSMTGAAGGAISGNLAGWITTAMALTGVSSDWFGPLSQIIEHESGGDPMSINLWDSNAAAGHPSKGLMQLIDENMADHHLPGMDNIYDPISNIAAGIRLIQHDYGSVYNVPGVKALARGGSYVGYALGTTYATPGYHVVGEHGPELLKMRGGEQVTDHRNSKKLNSKGVVVNMYGTIIREDADVDKIATSIVKKMILAGDNM